MSDNSREKYTFYVLNTFSVSCIDFEVIEQKGHIHTFPDLHIQQSTVVV
jgi:hypothetical protein